MRWTTATGLFLVLAMGGAATAFVLTRKAMPPDEVLAEVRGAMAHVHFDGADALRRLGRALRSAQASADTELSAGILQTRSAINRQLGAFGRARVDIEAILNDGRRSDRTVELSLAELEALDGDMPMALERIRDILEREPEFPAAWELMGRLEAASARGLLDATLEKIKLSLARVDAAEAGALLEELAARAPDDPAVASLRFQLSEIFASTQQSGLFDVLALVALPREAQARAREAYATSIAIEPTADRVVALAALLVNAGQLERAITLEFAAQNIPAIGEDPGALASLLAHLAQAGRVDEARLLLGAWNWEAQGTLEFYRSSAEVFYQLGTLAALSPIARQLERLGAQTGESWYHFYKSLGAINKAQKYDGPADLNSSQRKRLGRSEEGLRKFVTDTDLAEPFLGARIDAWFWLAEVYRYLDQPQRERDALRTGLRLRPEHSADAWLRLATTLKTSPKIQWADVEDALTQALNLAPQRTSEIVDDWLAAGQMAIESRGLSVDSLIGEATRQHADVPRLRKLGPAALTLLARAHREKGSPTNAQRAANRALREHANLIPPRDVIIRAKLLDTSRYYNVERDIVARIEVAGIDKSAESFLAELPAGRLEGADLVRAIRAAPVRFGKPAVARWLQERGDSSRAGQALVGLDPKNSPPSLRLLYARTLIDDGRFDDAIVQLDEIANDERSTSEALLMKAEALTLAGRDHQLGLVVREFMQPQTAPAELLEMADLLMASGQAELALPIVDHLDGAAATRTPEFYQRRILVDLLLAPRRGIDTAAESIARAEAYLRDGTPELAAIIFAVARRDWTRLPVLARRLRNSKFSPTPEEDVALALLEERFEAGRRQSGAALEASPRDPAWAFLSAAAASLVDARAELPEWFGPRAGADAELFFRGPEQRKAQDPRDALMLFLVSRQPEWAPWLLPRLEKLRESTGSTIWAPWLASRMHETGGDRAAVGALVTELVQAHPGFGPAHDMALRLVLEDHPDKPLHPSVVRVRRMRLESLGAELIDDPVEIALAEAGGLYRKKRYRQAAQAIQTVIKAGGAAETEGQVILGMLMIKLRQPSFAAQYLYEAAMGDPGILRELAVDSLLFSLRHAIVSVESGKPQRGAIDRDRALEMLGALARRYPLDPIVALTNLELRGLDDGERAARAQGILDRLHDESGRQSLESLRADSTRPWVEMLLPIAPEIAHEIVQRDLELEPGNLTLWFLSGMVAEARGLHREARVAYETHLAIDPAPGIGYALAAVIIREGDRTADLEAVLLAADEEQGGGSLLSRYLRALGEMRSDKPRLRRVIDGLTGVWKGRARAKDEHARVEIGLLYADALFRRHSESDLEALASLLEELAPIAANDLYAGELVQALTGMSRELHALARVAEVTPVEESR